MVYIIVSYFTTDNNKKSTWHSYNLGSRSEHNNIYEYNIHMQVPSSNTITQIRHFKRCISKSPLKIEHEGG
jgi:hypothetical protein